MITRRENLASKLVSYAVLVAAGVVGLRLNPPAAAIPPWVIVALLVVIGVVQSFPPKEKSPGWQNHLYLGAYGGLVAALMFLQPGWTMYPVLYVTPITWAMLRLPLRQAVYWTAAYTATTAASFVIGTTPGDGLIAGFLYGVLYSFIGAFAQAVTRAESARRESQRLLEELRGAHRKLQEYAGRVEELAVVEERNRLAREMHDTVGHRLTVAAVQLEAAQRLCSADPERSKAMVGNVREEVREALAELRSTVAALRAPVEEDLRLRTSLRRLVSHFQEATGLTVHQVLPEELPALPAAHRLALYRAAQEALTNVQRHAQASQVWLVVSASDSAISLLVSDDGKGLTLTSGQEGFGLAGLRERARELGGDLYLEPRHGGGTQLTFRLPLGEQDGLRARPGAAGEGEPQAGDGPQTRCER